MEGSERGRDHRGEGAGVASRTEQEGVKFSRGLGKKGCRQIRGKNNGDEQEKEKFGSQPPTQEKEKVGAPRELHRRKEQVGAHSALGRCRMRRGGSVTTQTAHAIRLGAVCNIDMSTTNVATKNELYVHSYL